MYNKKRLVNRILQIFYRPAWHKKRYISAQAFDVFDELDQGIEEKTATFMEELFGE